MPTSAAASAGASLTPSPTIATGAVALRAAASSIGDLVGRQQVGVRLVEPQPCAERSAAFARSVAGQQHDPLDAFPRSRATARRPSSRISSAQADHAERRAVVADEHRRARRVRSTSSMRACSDGVQSCRSSNSRWLPTIAGAAADGRFGAESRQRAERLARRDVEPAVRARDRRWRGRSDARIATSSAAATASTPSVDAPSTREHVGDGDACRRVSVPVLSNATRAPRRAARGARRP